MITAQATEETKLIETSKFETTNAMAELTKRMFTELQVVNANLGKQALMLEGASTTTEKLKAEILEGYPNRPSMRSQVELLNSRVDGIERASRGGALPKEQISIPVRVLVGALGVLLLLTLGLGVLIVTKARDRDAPVHEGG
jgi:hypothetical protein